MTAVQDSIFAANRVRVHNRFQAFKGSKPTMLSKMYLGVTDSNWFHYLAALSSATLKSSASSGM